MRKLKILLAEDDVNFGMLLKEFLQMKMFEVVLCKDGIDALEKFKKYEFDLCLLDVMMPKKDGFTLATEIRKNNKEIPLIFLTAKSLINDKVTGFNIGADDYITKPFDTKELLLRINAILKRTKQTIKGNIKSYKIGKYKFDFEKRLLQFGKDERYLTSKEAYLLKLLCENKNEIIKREKALNLIWKETNYFTARSMDVYITKLRRYLKKDERIKIINIHGVGYKLAVE